MTHEFKNIVFQAKINQDKGLKNVLATVVHLEGSSYRKPGVRMLICENGQMVGAVSGGCIEKEIDRQAQSVFKDEIAKVMTYDGRYRLGCEGVLYILIEPFSVSDELLNVFRGTLQTRNEFTIESYFLLKDNSFGSFGSIIKFQGNYDFKLSNHINTKDLEQFSQILKPRYRLLIIGGEHDAVKLCSMASILGWEVDVVTSINEAKQHTDFPGATNVISQSSETIDLNIDDETAVVLMTHNYVRDLKFLLKLEPFQIKYIGIIGSTKRREQLQSELIHYSPDLSLDFLERIYSPAGLHIGAETPEEIALSILSEILSVFRQTQPMSLKTFTGKIHTE